MLFRSVLTLLVHGQHEGPVLRVQVEKDRGPHQVLGEVAKQGGGSEEERTGSSQVGLAQRGIISIEPRS